MGSKKGILERYQRSKLTYKEKEITEIKTQEVSFEDLIQIVKIIRPNHTIDLDRLKQYYEDYRDNPTEFIVDTIGVYFEKKSQLEKEEKEYAENFSIWIEEPFELPPLEYSDKEKQDLEMFHSYCKKELTNMTLSQQAFLFRLLINVFPPPEITLEEDYINTVNLSSAVSKLFCSNCTNPICCSIHKSEFPSSKPYQHNKSEFCYYLGEKGCQIYNIRPKICRQWDCWKLSNEEFIKITNLQYYKQIRG